MSRDYAAEMRAVIDSDTNHGPYISRVIAREIVEKLEANDSDLLHGWLMAHAEQLIWGAINQRDRSVRGSARTTASRSAFAAAAEEHDEGDSSALGHWLGCRYVVDTYDNRAKANAFEAAFMRALSKKVGRGTVADHFDDEKIAALRRSLG